MNTGAFILAVFVIAIVVITPTFREPLLGKIHIACRLDRGGLHQQYWVPYTFDFDSTNTLSTTNSFGNYVVVRTYGPRECRRV